MSFCQLQDLGLPHLVKTKYQFGLWECIKTSNSTRAQMHNSTSKMSQWHMRALHSCQTSCARAGLQMFWRLMEELFLMCLKNKIILSLNLCAHLSQQSQPCFINNNLAGCNYSVFLRNNVVTWFSYWGQHSSPCRPTDSTYEFTSEDYQFFTEGSD